MRLCGINRICGSHWFLPPASLRPLPLNIQWWCSCYRRPPSTVNLSARICTHQVHPTNKACQASPPKKFLKRHAKRCEPVPSFSSASFHQIHHQVHPTNQSCQACPSKPFLNRHSKRCGPVPYFSSDSFHQIHHWFPPTDQACQTCPYYQSLDRNSKLFDPDPSFLIRFIIYQWLLWYKAISLLLLMHLLLTFLPLFEKEPYPRTFFAFW